MSDASPANDRVTYRRDGAIAVITLDDGKANILGPAMQQAMDALVETLNERRQVFMHAPARRLDEIAHQLDRPRDGSSSVRRAHGSNASACNAPRQETL